jgi:hypothetical protein
MNATPQTTDKRLLKRQYREAGTAMGVYAIRNRATGRVRLRASMNLEGSMQRDRFELGLKAHRDKELLGEWQRWGAEHFSFDVVDTLKKRDDPAFDYRDELASLLALWTEELRAGPPATGSAPAAGGRRQPPPASVPAHPLEGPPCPPR